MTAGAAWEWGLGGWDLEVDCLLTRPSKPCRVMINLRRCGESLRCHV